MKAKAPGKLVLSGAYAVLEGAPALVTAVDRYVLADSSHQAPWVTPEVSCALQGQKAPFFDAQALRSGERKLGLGSSAAIVVASLAALLLDEHPELSNAQLAERVWPEAVRAHRQAQAGGSGIDVLTSALGGTRLCWLQDGELQSENHRLPQDLHIDVYACPQASSTASMLAQVRAFALRAPGLYRRLIEQLTEAAHAAVQAQSANAFAQALHAQAELLAKLGDEAKAPIVPQSLRPVLDQAYQQNAAVLPSGAGGGDLVLCAGDRQTCEQLRAPLRSYGLERLDLALEAPGVHRVD